MAMWATKGKQGEWGVACECNSYTARAQVFGPLDSTGTYLCHDNGAAGQTFRFFSTEQEARKYAEDYEQ